MLDFNKFCESYGIRPMSVNEEANLPYYEKQTRNNKIHMIDTCESMRRMLNSIEYRMKRAPELNNKEHAELVDNFRKLMDESFKALDKYFRFM